MMIQKDYGGNGHSLLQFIIPVPVLVHI